MAGFLDPLELEYVDGTTWTTTKTFDYGENGGTIQVPAGFCTDFASVPKVFWNILPPTGSYGKAAVVHDFLYRNPGGRSRGDCDQVFNQAMETLGVGAWTRHTMYLGVRAGGWKPWNTYRSKEKESK